MSILINQHTRVLVQGITGKSAQVHTQQCRQYGTSVVAGVVPMKGGQMFDGTIPIYNTVEQAVRQEGVTASLIFVPPAAAADAILESIEAHMPLIVCITEGIPLHDMMRVKEKLAHSSSILVGPNCAGIITPGKCKMGIMPDYIHSVGSVGVVSRSGTLSYEATWQLTQRGYGQSTCIGIGGDPIHGMSFTDAVKLFNEDPNTSAIVLIGEIGGHEEEDVAHYVKEFVEKPVCAYIAGEYAPEGRPMGHAGAIMGKERGRAHSKIEAFKRAGIAVADNIYQIADVLSEVYKK